MYIDWSAWMCCRSLPLMSADNLTVTSGGTPNFRRLSVTVSRLTMKMMGSGFSSIGLLLLWRHVVGARFPQRLLLRDLRRQVRSLALAALPQQHLHLRHHLRLRLALVLGLADCGRLQLALADGDAEELMNRVLIHAQAARLRVTL